MRFAETVSSLIAARFIDRVGKGIRDALVADITPPELRGAAFGEGPCRPARPAAAPA